MDLTLTVTRADGFINVVDQTSGIGLRFADRAEVQAFLKRTDGEEWEQSFRAAVKEIASRDPDLEISVKNKVFTFTPAKAVTSWP